MKSSVASTVAVDQAVSTNPRSRRKRRPGIAVRIYLIKSKFNVIKPMHH